MFTSEGGVSISFTQGPHPSMRIPEFCLLLLMIQILHYLKDPKLWELWIFLIMGNAGFISSAVNPT